MIQAILGVFYCLILNNFNTADIGVVVKNQDGNINRPTTPHDRVFSFTEMQLKTCSSMSNSYVRVKGYCGMVVFLWHSHLGRGILACGTELDVSKDVQKLSLYVNFKTVDKEPYFLAHINESNLKEKIEDVAPKYEFRSEIYMRWNIKSDNHITEMVQHQLMVQNFKCEFPSELQGLVDLYDGKGTSYQLKTVISDSSSNGRGRFQFGIRHNSDGKISVAYSMSCPLG